MRNGKFIVLLISAAVVSWGVTYGTGSFPLGVAAAGFLSFLAAILS